MKAEIDAPAGVARKFASSTIPFVERPTCTIAEACSAVGFGKTKLYDLNPFNTYWYASAKTRALQLMEASPAHRDKYLWFLALHDAVGADDPMIPPAKLKQYVADGSLKWNPPR